MVKSDIRVLFVSYTAHLSGPTNSLLLLIQHLRRRYKIAVLLPGQGLFSEALASAQIPFFSFPHLAKWSIPAIFRLIKREQVDLVYGDTTLGSSRNALIAAKVARVPFICHVRAIADGRPWHRSAFLNLADAVIAVSHACSGSLRGRVFVKRAQVVHNGIEIAGPDANAASLRSRLRREFGITNERSVLINVGRIIPMKGQEYAVRVAARSIRRGVDVDLLLVGSDQDTRYVDYLKTSIGELGVENRVKLTSFREDVLSLLAMADVFIHTSLEEAHPRAILEAMAARLPVVAFDVGGVSETVVHGETGYLLPVGDVSGMVECVVKLLTDRVLRAEMGSEGRRRVETHFSASATADQVSKIISQVLQRN